VKKKLICSKRIVMSSYHVINCHHVVICHLLFICCSSYWRSHWLYIHVIALLPVRKPGSIQTPTVCIVRASIKPVLLIDSRRQLPRTYVPKSKKPRLRVEGGRAKPNQRKELLLIKVRTAKIFWSGCAISETN
jgi:hypothetical protein